MATTMPRAQLEIQELGLDRAKLTWMYRTMLRIRRFEERVKQLFRDARLRGSVHLYIGEEAVATGACAALRPDDYITSTHRGHGHCIAKGGRLDRMMAELYGRETGYCKGKGGSMHIADLDSGILGANGIVGAGIPIAVGAALGTRILGRDRVALAFFGDGGANQGAFHEGINFAAVQKLPVVFVCENNLYSQTTPNKYTIAGGSVARRAEAYGIPGERVDGQDVLAVYRSVKAAVDRARAGQGPTLIECMTYRFEGHFLGDPETYRSREEVQEWREKRDPISLFAAKLLATGQFSQAELDQIDQEVLAEVEDAVRFAENSPLPRLEALWEDVYA
jgi:pyruvate dehydrogenase E1 component alpha subunit